MASRATASRGRATGTRARATAIGRRPVTVSPARVTAVPPGPGYGQSPYPPPGGGQPGNRGPQGNPYPPPGTGPEQRPGPDGGTAGLGVTLRRESRTEGVDLARAEAAVRELLFAIGEDPDREGLKRTPARVARAYSEIFAGLFVDPDSVLETTFDEDHDELVLVKDIPLYSICEHHLLPWHGTAAVGYIPGPDGRITGLSKLARLVDLYARRPQVQERLTSQVADALRKGLRTARRHRRDSGGASLHGHAGDTQARLAHRDLSRTRHLPERPPDPRGGAVAGAGPVGT